MKIIISFCLLILVLSCEDKQTRKKTSNISEAAKPVKKLVKEDKNGSPEREFPKLNSRSAMDFFLEYDKQHKENTVRLTTDFGDIDIFLFNQTRFHRSNFIWLTKQKYFDGTQFYRVIDNFMVQAGNSDDRITARKRAHIGKYLLPADTKRGFKHDRGVVSMPSSEIDNPHKLASPYEFFIVQQKGGAHFLDGDYTIFGRVIKGMDVVDKIAAVDTDDGDWPMKNVFIRKAVILK